MHAEWKRIADDAVREWRSNPDLYHNLPDLVDEIAETIQLRGFRLKVSDLDLIEDYVINLF